MNLMKICFACLGLGIFTNIHDNHLILKKYILESIKQMVLHHEIIVLICGMQNKLYNDWIVPFRLIRIMYLFPFMKIVIPRKIG